jgi:hypothetical protein
MTKNTASGLSNIRDQKVRVWQAQALFANIRLVVLEEANALAYSAFKPLTLWPNKPAGSTFPSFSSLKKYLRV